MAFQQDAHLGEHLLTGLLEGLPEGEHMAFVWIYKPAKDFDERRLAGTVWAEQPGNLSLFKPEVDVR